MRVAIFRTMDWMNLRKASTKSTKERRYTKELIIRLPLDFRLLPVLQGPTQYANKPYDEAYDVSQDLSMAESFDAGREKVSLLLK